MMENSVKSKRYKVNTVYMQQLIESNSEGEEDDE